MHSVKREIAARKNYSHRPDIGVNKHISVETRKRDFFQRLYSHQDPNIGNRKRAASADAMRGRSTGTGNNSTRSRSVSRAFTSGRRREFEGVQQVVANCSKLTNSTNKWKSDRPWGIYTNRSSSQNAKMTPKREETKQNSRNFYNYVFSDYSGAKANSRGSPSIDAESLSREEQLQLLANKFLEEKTGGAAKKKLSDEAVEKLVTRYSHTI